MAHHGGGGGGGGLYSVLWIMILDPDYRFWPTKTINPVGKGWEHVPSFSVCDPACLLGV